MPRGVLLVALACSLAVVLGCSGSGTTAKGKVLFEGKAVSGAEVAFIAKEKGGGKGGYSGKTDAEGNFEIRATGTKQIPPGTYSVVVSKWVDRKTGKDVTDAEEMEQMRARGDLRNLLPTKYSEASTSNLSAEIKAGENVLPPFDLKKSP
ncbi:MAG TPA: hypothetical protein VEL76_18255 [Gemmataceae bacterium]|nr:hypothetical protein [Gemmataceae bacterium]